MVPSLDSGYESSHQVLVSHPHGVIARLVRAERQKGRKAEIATPSTTLNKGCTHTKANWQKNIYVSMPHTQCLSNSNHQGVAGWPCRVLDLVDSGSHSGTGSAQVQFWSRFRFGSRFGFKSRLRIGRSPKDISLKVLVVWGLGSPVNRNVLLRFLLPFNSLLLFRQPLWRAPVGSSLARFWTPIRTNYEMCQPNDQRDSRQRIDEWMKLKWSWSIWRARCDEWECE